MRVSVHKTDVGYSHEAVWFNVYLDGVKLERCFTADEELGEAWVYKADENGKLIMAGGEVVKECLRGRVELRRIPA